MKASRIVWPAVAIVLAALLATTLLAGPEKAIEQPLTHQYSVRDPQFRGSMGVLLGPAIVAGNSVRALQNGEEIFPSMLEAIAGARRTIAFETYIYWSGDIGRRFAEALAERARAGVQVLVLLDWLGSVKMDQALLDAMRRAGVEVERYHEPSWWQLSRMNNRTHRKLLVVDGTVGFTGGVGIADQWSGDAEDAEHWRDSHFRAEGPVAAQVQAVFMDNWVKASGRVLHGGTWFPEIAPAGRTAAQMFSSSPSGGSNSMRLMYLLAIAAATESIQLASAYFVPDDMAVEAFVAAARRGVRIDIIVPGPIIDTDVVRSASRERWGPLLEAGIGIHEYQPTMFHRKVLVVDRHFVSVGSTNFDNRSFELNDEANLNIYDDTFAKRASEVFAGDLKETRKVTLEAWRERPWREKVADELASLLGAQL